MKFKVRLYSEECGAEFFDYDTEAEALVGFQRLLKSATEHQAKDGIVREVSILVGEPKPAPKRHAICPRCKSSGADVHKTAPMRQGAEVYHCHHCFQNFVVDYPVDEDEEPEHDHAHGHDQPVTSWTRLGILMNTSGHHDHPSEQTISGALSSLDELIGAESRKLDALKAHKKGLQQLFQKGKS
jgi:hypothetical protein